MLYSVKKYNMRFDYFIEDLSTKMEHSTRSLLSSSTKWCTIWLRWFWYYCLISYISAKPWTFPVLTWLDGTLIVLRNCTIFILFSKQLNWTFEDLWAVAEYCVLYALISRSFFNSFPLKWLAFRTLKLLFQYF